MRADVMSAGVMGMADERRTATWSQATPERTRLQSVESWDPEVFAREQIRRLVRQVFFASTPQPARQVVFSAIEPHADIPGICVQVGHALAIQTSADVVAVVGALPGNISQYESGLEEKRSGGGIGPLRKRAMRLRENLWLVPNEIGEASHSSAFPHSFSQDVRREFEYSVVEAPAAGDSSAAMEMAQAADGVILVVCAQRTRRASALKIKQMFEDARVRILGAMLTEREFPIPERIYRRL